MRTLLGLYQDFVGMLLGCSKDFVRIVFDKDFVQTTLGLSSDCPNSVPTNLSLDGLNTVSIEY
jgi:hypothetical protein